MIDKETDLALIIGRNLRDRRQQAFPHDTQRDMAARLSVGIATYSRMERGDARVSFRHYLEAARLLRCEGQTAELFTRPDQREGLIDRLVKENNRAK